MIEKYLQEIGLNEREAQVYVALLQMESASVIDIAKKTKINRSTMYLVLEDLLKKGLVTEIQIGKKMYYQSVAPERLETFIEKQKLELDEQSKRLKDIMPMLKGVQREGGAKPVVKYFEGREGVVNLLEEFFKSKDKEGVMYSVFPKGALDEVFTQEEREKYRKIRIDKKIKVKALYTAGAMDFAIDTLGERIRIDEKKYPIFCDIAVHKDNVRINTLNSSLSGIFIQNKDLAATLRSIFDLVHDLLNEKKKKPRE